MGWFLLLWAGGVAVAGLVAVLLRVGLHLAGLVPGNLEASVRSRDMGVANTFSNDFPGSLAVAAVNHRWRQLDVMCIRNPPLHRASRDACPQ
jgi:hypothetical protein